MRLPNWLLAHLVCPACRTPLTFTADDPDEVDGCLSHPAGGCPERYPVIDGIPRLLLPPHRGRLVRAKRDWFEAGSWRRALAAEWSAPGIGDDLVADFDFEWSAFRSVGTAEHRTVFDMYFDLLSGQTTEVDSVVLDAGCGAGRWAVELASRGPRVIAVDLGTSVELASANAAHTGRVACVQADLRSLPLASQSVDWAYSLGVLHHIDPPTPVLHQLFDAIRPGGQLLVYLYYALDERGPAFRALYRMVDAIRRRTSLMPRRAVLVVAWAMALFVYWPLARAAAVARRLGLRGLSARIPLSFYAERSFQIMLNDSLDRFGTRIERRYTKDEMRSLLRSTGFDEITFSPSAPFWHAVAHVPGEM